MKKLTPHSAAAIDKQLSAGPACKRVGLVGLERVPVREGAALVDGQGQEIEGVVKADFNADDFLFG